MDQNYDKSFFDRMIEHLQRSMRMRRSACRILRENPIDPKKVTQYERTDPELEEFMLFAASVTGAESAQRAVALECFLSERGDLSPFQWVMHIYRSEGSEGLVDRMKRCGLGQQLRLLESFVGLASCGIDLRSCSLEALESFKGIKRKSSRFFTLHSRPGVRIAALDVHILRKMREHGVDHPYQDTPSDPAAYAWLEQEFIRLADEMGMTPAELDIAWWTEIVEEQERMRAEARARREKEKAEKTSTRKSPAASIRTRANPKDYLPSFIGQDDGTWEESKMLHRPLHGWKMDDAMASNRQFDVDGASQSNTGFRHALGEILRRYPQFSSVPIRFDGRPTGTVSEFLASPPFEWETSEFMHGTSLESWEKIRREGLKSRAETGVSPAYGRSSSARPGDPSLIYLTLSWNTVAFAARDAGAISQSVPAVLVVNGIKEIYAKPDEDSGETTARASLDRLGSIGYRRSIRPDQIKLAWVLDRESRLWKGASRDMVAK